VNDSQELEHKIPILKPSYLVLLDELPMAFDHLKSRDLFLFGLDDGSIQIVDNKLKRTTDKLQKQDDGAGGVVSMLISPNESFVAIGTSRGYLKIFDLTTNKSVFSSKIGAFSIEKLLWSKESDQIYLTCGKLLFHIKINNFELFEYASHPSTVTGLKHLNENLVGTTSYSQLRLFENSVQNPYQTFEWKGSLTSLDFTPDEKFAVCTAQDMSIHLWDLDRGKDLAMNGFPAKVKSVSFSSKGQKMACDSADYILIWDFTGPGPAGRKPKMSQQLPEKIDKVLYSPKDNTLISLLKDGVILFWNDEHSLEVPTHIAGIKDAQTVSIDFSKDGNSVVTTLHNNYAVVYNMESCKI
jgi:WD40 repeat protein